jgi:hypothetical protein
LRAKRGQNGKREKNRGSKRPASENHPLDPTPDEIIDITPNFRKIPKRS